MGKKSKKDTERKIERDRGHAEQRDDRQDDEGAVFDRRRGREASRQSIRLVRARSESARED